ncbi:MAG: FMN-binding protein [Ruminococcus sp.]|nr:FMN-binding protein [Ruminococcus sp.]
MKSKIMPSLVLTIICAAAAFLLVFAYELTKERIAEQKQIRFSKSVEALFGTTDCTLIDDNFGEKNILAIAVTSDNKTAIQVSADGYSKGGINVLIGIDENGTVSGIEFVSLEETPGLGTKIRDNEDFRKQFYGEYSAESNIDTISGATFSSKGLKSAVDTALKVYGENKEAILNGGK